MIHFNPNNPLYKLFCAVRSPLVRLFKPRRLYPISTKFGFDRGLPIDRYYINQFLTAYKQNIRGACLEIHDADYTKKYGEGRVASIDVLDIDRTNKLATIYGDLRNLTTISDNAYDCLIITQTFGLFDNHEAAACECWRILKPGGSLLATFSTLGPLREQEQTHWRFTPLGVKSLFEKFFSPQKMSIMSHGNVLACQCFLVGLAADELADAELKHNDPWYPLIIGLHAVK